MGKSKRWSVSKTTKYFIDLILADEQKEKDSEIIKFRNRWKLGNKGLKNENFYQEWKKKVEKTCQGYCDEVVISEVEVYFRIGEGKLPGPIFSSSLEDRVRTMNFGDSLTSVFAVEVRVLGKKLKIPAEYDGFLEYYLIYNKMKFKFIFNRGITTTVRFRFTEKHGLLSENVCLILGENTLSTDFDNYWDKQIKPHLHELPGRINGIRRIGENTWLITKMKKHKERDGGWSSVFIDEATDKNIRVGDRELITERLKEKALNKLYSSSSSENEKETNRKINRSLARKVYNVRQYRFKKKHLH
jgi:hypothetical protein